MHREIREELSITIEPTHLLSIDYISNRDVKEEYVQLLFAAKDLTEWQAQNIKIPPYELKDYRFVSIEKALDLLIPLVSRRVASSLEFQESQRERFIWKMDCLFFHEACILTLIFSSGDIPLKAGPFKTSPQFIKSRTMTRTVPCFFHLHSNAQCPSYAGTLVDSR